MNKLLLVCLFLSLVGMIANSAPAQGIESGLYNAVDVDSGTVNAKLLIRTNGTLKFSVNTPDFEMPEPGCEGTYIVTGHTFASNLKCPIAMMSEVSVKIDITTVTAQSLRSSEGALVPVVIDAFGADPMMFRLKIIEAR